MTRHCKNCSVALIRRRHPCGKLEQGFASRLFCSGHCHRRHRKREASRAQKMWASLTRVYLPFEQKREPPSAALALGGEHPARLGLADRKRVG